MRIIEHSSQHGDSFRSGSCHECRHSLFADVRVVVPHRLFGDRHNKTRIIRIQTDQSRGGNARFGVLCELQQGCLCRIRAMPIKKPPRHTNDQRWKTMSCS